MAGENAAGHPRRAGRKGRHGSAGSAALAHDPVIHFNAIDFGKGGRRSGNGHACMAFNRNRRGKNAARPRAKPAIHNVAFPFIGLAFLTRYGLCGSMLAGRRDEAMRLMASAMVPASRSWCGRSHGSACRARCRSRHAPSRRQGRRAADWRRHHQAARLHQGFCCMSESRRTFRPATNMQSCTRPEQSMPKPELPPHR